MRLRATKMVIVIIERYFSVAEVKSLHSKENWEVNKDGVTLLVGCLCVLVSLFLV